MVRRGILAMAAAVTFMAATPVFADDMGLLAGTWRGQTAFMGHPAQVETVLLENGTFTSMMQVSGGAMMRHWGEWRVVQANTLRLTYHGHEPTRFCGPLGCQNIAQVDAETVFYRFLDADTLQTRPSVCMTQPCGMAMSRLR